MKTRSIIRGLIVAFFISACQDKEASGPLPETGDYTGEALITVNANFDDGAETRSYLDVPEDSSPAKVLWQAGDSFKMCVKSATSSYSAIDFTTEEEGSSYAAFSAASSVTGGPCYCVYPAEAAGNFSILNASPVMTVSIPSQQTAVAGGVERGLIRAAAFSDSVEDDLAFKNLLPLIRFRLSGDLVPDLESIEFDARTVVAGVATVYFKEAGPYVRFSYNWPDPSVARSTKVTLTGPFAPDTDYYIALAPADLSGFSMVFKGGGGQLTKYSSKSLSLTRSHIINFGTIDVGSVYDDPQEYAVTKYMTQTKGRKPLDICVIPEGFTSAELTKFESLAAEGIDYLFSTEPYKTYKDYFNVYIMNVPSRESGASITDGNGTVTTGRDTYFNARWGQDSYSDMIADGDAVFGFVSNRCPEILDGTLTVEDVPILMIINDSRYGGRCHVFSSGKGYAMVPFTDNGGPLSWSINSTVASQDEPVLDYSYHTRQFTTEELEEMGSCEGTWKEVVIHEFGGHCFARLDDEYWNMEYVTSQSAISTQSWSVPFGLNVSGFYDTVPWDSLLANLEELVATDGNYARIGRYQGAAVSMFNRWRSEMISCMIDTRPYFSTWQRMLIVKRIMEKTGMEYSDETFFANDITADPIRDETEKLVRGAASPLPVHKVPLPAPPVLTEE